MKGLWNKKKLFSTPEELLQNCVMAIFFAVCVCVFSSGIKRLWNKMIFNTRRIYAELYQGNVCVSECVCVYVCTFLCGGGGVCVCTRTCHVIGRGRSMGRGNGRCVYVHVCVLSVYSDHTAHLPASLRCLLSGVDQLLQASQLLLQHLFPVQGLLKNTANSKHGPSFKCSKYLQQTHTHKRLSVKVSTRDYQGQKQLHVLF